MSDERYSQALEAQLEIAAFYSSYAAIEFLNRARRIASGTAAEFWLSATKEFAYMVVSAAWYGDTHFVSSEVCDMVDKHAELMPPDATLKPSLLSEDMAFIYLARPGVSYVPERAVRALMVIKIDGKMNKSNADDGLMMLLFTTAANRPWKTPILTGIAFWNYGTSWSFVPDMPVGQDLDQVGMTTDEIDMEFRTQKRNLLALLAFEKQKLTVTSEHRADRTARKRIEDSARSESMVKVVKLRKTVYLRAESDSTPTEGTGRHVSCRYYVEPFWRNQYYPSENDHHPKLVVDHWRGKGPVRITRKVYTVVQ